MFNSRLVQRFVFLFFIMAFLLVCSEDRDNPLDPTLPDAGRFNLSAELKSNGLDLRWEAPDNDAIVGYRIHRLLAGQTRWAVIDSVNSDQTVYLDTSLIESGEIDYRVTAKARDGRDSAPSGECSVSLRLRSWTQLENPPNGQVKASLEYEGKLVIAGEFTTIGGVYAPYLATWDGRSWGTLGNGVDGPLTSLAVYEQRLIVGGKFENAGGVAANSVAAWNGSTWLPLGTTYFDSVTAMTVFGERLIVSATESYSGSTIDLVNSWSGTNWRFIGAFHGHIKSLVSFDGNLIAAGDIDSLAQRANWYNSSNFDLSIKQMAIWNQLGDYWDSFPVDFPGYFVRDIIVWKNQLFVVGSAGENRIVEWDGFSWTPISNSPGLYTTTYRDVVEYNGKLAIGMTYNQGLNSTIVATWDGSQWVNLAVGNEDNIVTQLWTFNGTLFAVGSFVMQNGKGAANYASWFDFDK